MKKKIYASFSYFLFIIIIFSCNKNKIESASTQTQRKDILINNYKEKIEITTIDNVKLKGVFYCPYPKSEKYPLVILIHQYKSNKEQWKKDFIDTLLSKNFSVLIYDIRNHGESEKTDIKLEKLLTDPYLAPNDLISIFNWVKHNNLVDTNRISVVGTSIGASLAIYAKYYLNAKTIVGISGGLGTFQAFTGINILSMNAPIRTISSVLFICGDKDNNYLNDEKLILDNYVTEPKDIKIFDSNKHGKELINEFPEINNIIVEWLIKYL